MRRRSFLKAAPLAIAAKAFATSGSVEETTRSGAGGSPLLQTFRRNGIGAQQRIVEGAARFTVITAECIRMEYAPKYGFVDAPTLFAMNRDEGYAKATVTRQDGAIVIDTGKLQLTYRPDGKAPHADNLSVTFNSSSTSQTWHPGKKNERNLKGPVATLDGVKEPFELPDGLLSRDGWYLLDDSGRHTLQDGWISQRKGGGPPGLPSVNNPDIDWYLFAYGTEYKSALNSLTALSGPVPMPRSEVHGAWYCRWYPYTADQFREIVAGYKLHDFPLDILVMDMEWHTKNATSGFGHAHQLGWTGYTWNRTLLPDPASLLKELRDDGIYVTLNDHPHDGIRQHEECYPAFMQMLNARVGEDLPFDAGNRRYMEAFFAASHKPLEQQGVDFWWVDWQQDTVMPWVHGAPGLRHLPWLNFLYYRRSQDAGLRGQGFSRWGGWGDHRHPIQFSGDAHSSWPMLEFEIDFTLASGNAGCFFWAHDLGGFYGSFGTTADSELYTRWVQFGAFSSSLRLHSNPNIDRRPWLWGKPFEEAMREAFHLRSELFPYIYTSVRQCFDHSLPLLRPMYLDYPEEEAAYESKAQYLLGDHLLVAPIVTSGAGSDFVAQRQVWFPPGTWYGLGKLEKIAGGQVHSISATLDEIPVYVRSGIALPMQPYTARMASSPLETLRVRCYPGDAGETTLYEDDGRSTEYMQGGFARTKLIQKRAAGWVHVQIGPAEGRYKNQPASRAYRIELPYTQKAKSASFNGAPVAVIYDSERKMNVIDLPRCPITLEINCKVEVSEV